MLTDQQRALASSFHGYLLACGIERLANAGTRYFSLAKLQASTGVIEAISAGEQLGLWSRNATKQYWTHTALTWPFIRTAIALADERAKSWKHEPERAGR